MVDTQSSSSAEVEGYVAPPVSVQSVQFAPVPDPGHVQNPANDKSSRWSARDDVQLCDALIAQKNMGRNRDTAVFTLDAWNAVADQMKGSEIISGGAQKTVAQCKARWQRLKIEYRIVKHLRQQPGFQWDENAQMVTALAATWDAYVAEHRDAQPWRKKSFPAYDRVAFLIEDEHGRDAGEEGFKRRWNASTQPTQHVQEDEPPAPPDGGPASSTSVFSLNSTGEPTAPSMPFATQVVPGVAMAMPLNGGNSAIHQYRFSSQQPNCKRGQSPVSDHQTTTSKRPKSAASSTTTATSPPQTQYDIYASSSSPQAQPFTAGSVSYAPPSVSASAPASVSRLALAIQFVEDTEGLADIDFVKAVQLFQRRMEAADAYLAIQSKRARSMYLRAELEDFARS